MQGGGDGGELINSLRKPSYRPNYRECYAYGQKAILCPPKRIEGEYYVESTANEQEETSPVASFNLVWSVIGIQQWLNPNQQPVIVFSIRQAIEDMA